MQKLMIDQNDTDHVAGGADGARATTATEDGQTGSPEGSTVRRVTFEKREDGEAEDSEEHEEDDWSGNEEIDDLDEQDRKLLHEFV